MIYLYYFEVFAVFFHRPPLSILLKTYIKCFAPQLFSLHYKLSTLLILNPHPRTLSLVNLPTTFVIAHRLRIPLIDLRYLFLYIPPSQLSHKSINKGLQFFGETSAYDFRSVYASNANAIYSNLLRAGFLIHEHDASKTSSKSVR